MPKRACPFAPRGNQLKIIIDERHTGKEAYEKQVHEKTLALLGKGSAIAWGRGASTTTKISSDCKSQISPSCVSCKTRQGLAKCSFCDQMVCAVCTRTCSACDGSFCHLCSVINYDEHEERSFCLSCTT